MWGISWSGTNLVLINTLAQILLNPLVGISRNNKFVLKVGVYLKGKLGHRSTTVFHSAWCLTIEYYLAASDWHTGPERCAFFYTKPKDLSHHQYLFMNGMSE